MKKREKRFEWSKKGKQRELQIQKNFIEEKHNKTES